MVISNMNMHVLIGHMVKTEERNGYG